MAETSHGTSPVHKQKTVVVAVSSLKFWPGNARIGHLPTIIESLKELGQYKPVIVQKRTRRVIMGNNTLRGMRKLGWETCTAIFLDVDDEIGLKMNLQDNASSDKATYDRVALAEQILSVKDLKGTGYSEDDRELFRQIIDKDNSKTRELVDTIIKPDLPEEEYRDVELPEEMLEVGHGAHMASFKEEKVKLHSPYTDADVMVGNAVLLPELRLPNDQKVTEWEFPLIRADRLMEVKDLGNMNYKFFVSDLHHEWPDPDQRWLLTPRSNNDRGLTHPELTIMCYFTYDEWFEQVWLDPNIEAGKIINGGFKFVAAPDFSIWDQGSRMQNLWNLYRQRWMGRYFQEAGLKLIPHFSFFRDWGLFDEYVLPTLPPKCPVIAMELQMGWDGLSKSQEDQKAVLRFLRKTYDAIQPDVLMMYCEENTLEFIRRANRPWRLLRVDTYGKQAHMWKETQEELDVLAAKGLIRADDEKRRETRRK